MLTHLGMGATCELTADELALLSGARPRREMHGKFFYSTIARPGCPRATPRGPDGRFAC
jgi:hypothetical protein